MITAIAIDDEKNALGIIIEYAKKIEDLLIVETFTDPGKALTYIENNPDVNLVFLDIQMGHINGLSVARQLPKHIKVVLTTAHAEYALEGYELDILDYLLKPFTVERFERSLQKFRSYAKRSDQKELAFPANSLTPTRDDFIFVKTDYKLIKIRLDELRIIEGAGNYIALHLEKSKILTLQNMKAFEEYLLPYKFIRIHKSFIISLKHIDSIENNTIVIGDKIIPIGESYKENLQKHLAGFSRQF
jgi:two-component system LytT family response regulator